jgi:hypothetical protein
VATTHVGSTVVAAFVAMRFLTAAPTPAASCTAPAYHEFDFFAGDWDAFDVSAPTKVVARNHVRPMVDGCALREVYEQRDGLRGESFSAYDSTRRVWHQSWVTNHGTLLLLEGGLHAGRMVLTATETHPGAAPTLLRGTWWREGATVRERADRSADGGKSWTPVFDLIFRPHK